MRYLLAICGVAALSACSGTPAMQLGPDGQPAQRVYQIDEARRGEVTYSMLDSVNALRQARGMAPLQLNAALTAAAATHARDMSVQNRPWHFGSDGSSPLVRAQRAGYTGTLLGEDISETYQTETQTVGDWMNQTGTREVLLNRDASDVGISWYQESAGKLWWVINTGRGGGASAPYGMAMAQ